MVEASRQENDVMEEYVRTCINLNVNNVNLLSPYNLSVRKGKKITCSLKRYITTWQFAHVLTVVSLRHAAKREIKSRTSARTTPRSNSMCVLIRCSYRRIWSLSADKKKLCGLYRLLL